MLGDVDAADLNRAAGRPENAGNHTESGGFPGAVRSEKAEQLAAGNDELDVIDRGELAVALGKMDQSDQAILRTMASTSSRSASRSTTICSVEGKPLASAGKVCASSVAASSKLSCPVPVPTSGVAITLSSQSVARCHADTSARRTTSRPIVDSASRMMAWSTNGAARSPLPVTTAEPA